MFRRGARFESSVVVRKTWRRNCRMRTACPRAWERPRSRVSTIRRFSSSSFDFVLVQVPLGTCCTPLAGSCMGSILRERKRAARPIYVQTIARESEASTMGRSFPTVSIRSQFTKTFWRWEIKRVVRPRIRRAMLSPWANAIASNKPN